MTIEELLQRQVNMLVRGEWPQLDTTFKHYLRENQSGIEGTVSCLLSLQPHQECVLAEPSEWLRGDFNICVPISIKNWRTQRLMLRCPIPHRLGASQSNDLLDEKIRCEAATYAFISRNCSMVPVPRIWGFGLPDGKSYVCSESTHDETFFTPTQCPHVLTSGYLLVDFIEAEQGRVLAEAGLPAKDHHWQNLFRSISQIMLDLGRHTRPQISSMGINDEGALHFDNRPLTTRLAVLENDGIPTDMARDQCYQSADSFFSDLLHCVDLKLSVQPNAVDDDYDAELQMASYTIMRTLLSQFPERSLRRGPFILKLTDFHPGNFFVDQEYRITAMVDIEWACFLPIETQSPPFWITGHGFEDLVGNEEAKFDAKCHEFMRVFEEVDSQTPSQNQGFATRVMREVLQKGMHWFWLSLNEPDAMQNIFLDHLQPIFAPEHAKAAESAILQKMIAPYWTKCAPKFIRQKVSDKACYDEQLRSQFGADRTVPTF